MTTEVTARRTACAVVVHLAAHRPTAARLHPWCEELTATLAGAGVSARVCDRTLRQSVDGLDWRSDRGRTQLRDHLATPGTTLFSSAALLGAAYRHTGGPLYASATAGIDALAVALTGTAARVHLTVGDHASTMVRAWIDAVRQGHAVTFDELATSVTGPSWTPLVEHLVAALGADRVVVHDRTAPADGTASGDGTRDLLRALLDDLQVDLPVDLAASPRETEPDRTHWTRRQTEVALAMLPHLRSMADRAAMRSFVEESVDPDGTPAQPVPAPLADDLAARDAADLARISTLVEVRRP